MAMANLNEEDLDLMSPAMVSNTSLTAKGALAHRLQCRAACNTSPPA